MFEPNFTIQKLWRDPPLTELLRPLRESPSHLRNSCEGASGSSSGFWRRAFGTELVAGRGVVELVTRVDEGAAEGGGGRAGKPATVAGVAVLPFEPTVDHAIGVALVGELAL